MDGAVLRRIGLDVRAEAMTAARTIMDDINDQGKDLFDKRILTIKCTFKANANKGTLDLDIETKTDLAKTKLGRVYGCQWMEGQMVLEDDDAEDQSREAI